MILETKETIQNMQKKYIVNIPEVRGIGSERSCFLTPAKCVTFPTDPNQI